MVTYVCKKLQKFDIFVNEVDVTAEVFDSDRRVLNYGGDPGGEGRRERGVPAQDPRVLEGPGLGVCVRSLCFLAFG